MELNEDRRKKLEAGKEKLAAFRKKKAKRKKAETEKQTATKEIIEPLNGGELSPPEFSSWNDIHSLEGDSDQFFISSGDEFSSEEQETRSSVYYQAKLANARERISELEETVEGKQLALDSMMRENTNCDTQKIPHNVDLNFDERESNGLMYCDLERALAQRDELIAQLTESLRTSTDVPPTDSDTLHQIQSLSGQVSLLQNQLQQTNETMQEQSLLRDISSSALQTAKTQMLQLQSIVKDKDSELQSSQTQIKHLQSDLSEKNQEVLNLSKQIDNVSHLNDLQSKWHEQEKALQDELVSKSEEIRGLLNSDQQSKALVMELTDGSKEKDEKLQQLIEELDELKRIKTDIENESRELIEDNKELTAYRQNTAASLSNLDTLNAEFEKLRHAHGALLAEHEPLKSKYLLLENVVDELKQENAFSKSQLDDLKTQLEEEKERYTQQEKALLDMESRHSAYSDQLNNKLNDLQNRLSSSEEALSIEEQNLNDGRQQVMNLQDQLRAEECKLSTKCQELDEQLAQHSELLAQIQTKDDKIAEMEKLQQEFKEVAENLQNKGLNFEKANEDLQGKASKLEKELDEVKAENKMLSEQAIQLRDDFLSAEHVHGVEMSERDYRENNLEEQMELMNEDLNSAMKRSSELENKLKEKEDDLVTESEKQKTLKDQLIALESERDGLRETVQNLNSDIGQLKEELALEMKAPVEEKILAYENQQLNASLKRNDNETEEKVQLTILEEEILSLKTKLDEKESTCQCLEDKLHRCQSQHTEELESYRSNILRLEQDLESQYRQNDELSKELTGLKSALEKCRDELNMLEESQKTAGEELDKMKNEQLSLEAKKEEASSRIKELEYEADNLKTSHQTLQNREKELLESQEALEGHLEASVNECQKLQQLTDKREIQLQNLQDGLEEEMRKLSSLESSHENERSSLQADVELWREKHNQSEVAVNELQSAISSKIDELDMKAKELSEALMMVSEKEAAIKDRETQISSIESEMRIVSEENASSKEEISQLLARLERSQEERQTVQVDIEEVKAAFDKEKQEKESLLDKLDSNEKVLNSAVQHKEEIELLIQDLHGQLESKQSHIKDLTSQLEDLSHAIADLESKCLETNDLLSKEQLSNSYLSESLNKLKQEGLRLKGLMNILNEDLLEKEGVLIQQNTSLIGNTAQINHLNECLNEKEKAMKILEDRNLVLLAEKEQLETDKKVLADENQCFTDEVQKLTNEVVAHEQDISQLSSDNKQLQEELKEIKQEAEGKNILIHDLTHDSDIHRKEICDLKSDIEEKDCRIESLTSEMDTLQDTLHTSDEEKKLLKTNFDSCMEDMQQKLADQDAEVRRMKCQLAEESMSISESQIEMKEMFEQQLEDKLLSAEREKSKLEKEISESYDKIDALKESYENQMSELELSLQAANSECVKLNECIAKTNANFENEILDLKSLHELQRAELLDNSMSLEKTATELQKTLNENMEKTKIERGELEQSFEVQMLELDEKRRFSETEVARLKRQLDEMRKDHEMDVENLEKRYETQLFEMEDRCSVMGAELERARKSMMSVEGDFVEERNALESKVEDLENVRRELEIKISVLDDDLSNLKEQSQRREEEMKSILKNAAEKQTILEAELGCLRDELLLVNADKESSIGSLKSNYKNTLEDLETRNKHLEEKVSSLLKHAEEDMAFGSTDQEPIGVEIRKLLNSQISELKEQVAVLSDENISLKRRLLSHQSSSKKILTAGVEDICPNEQLESAITSHSLPKLMTSTPSKGFDSEDSFSPTVEEVSMIEGFVAEREQPVFACRKDILNKQSFEEDVGEPDFVAEETDRFQPEMVIEKVIESSEHGGHQLSIHPIREEAVTDGFQPEIGDQFLMETIEEPNVVWPSDLSVGLSPSSQDKQQFHYDDIPAADNNIETDLEPQVLQVPVLEISDQNTNCNLEEDHVDNTKMEEAKITSSELARKLANLKDSLEEEYVVKLRTQKRDLVVEYEAKQEDYQREMEFHFAQRAQSIKNDWEHKFAKALQKVRKDVERRHLKELRQARQGHQSKANTSIPPVEQRKESQSEEGMPDIAEGSEELDQKVQQLSRENQELAEARDELLKQIEISQARGLHHRVQHELQSKISGRDSPVSSLSPTQTLTSESPALEEVMSPTHTLTNSSPVHEEAFVLSVQVTSSSCVRPEEESLYVAENNVLDGPSPDNVSLEADSSHTEVSETSSARERFLEDFTDISQQSSADLPLEWELTTTIADAGEFERDPQQGSVWEVFDGRCMRQDCQELETLRSQYESKLSSLQGHLEKEREQNKHAMEHLQEGFKKMLSDFREQLDKEQLSLLDELISQLTKVHYGEIQDLEAKHEREVALEITAWRVTLEQVYKSKNYLEASEAEARHEKQLQEAREKHKDNNDETNIPIAATQGNPEDAFTQKYVNLIQKINQVLEEKILSKIDIGSSNQGVDSDVDSNKPGHQVPLSDDIQKILLDQQQEIMSLRSQMLGESESVLKSRVDNVEQSEEENSLEQQMLELQKQYDKQVEAFQQQIQMRDEEQKRITEEERTKLEHEQEELKSHYEKRMEEMEAAFEREINNITEKYDTQISGLIHARLSPSGEEHPSDITEGNVNSDSSHLSPAELSSKLKLVEGLLAERDVEIKDLKNRLDMNESLHSELGKFKDKVAELEKEVSDALCQCSKLQDLIHEKDSVIQNLEHEKSESEKLYRDLLEKESPRSKDSAAKDNFSGSSVDDSFCSARDDIQDTPRSFGSSDPSGTDMPDGHSLYERRNVDDFQSKDIVDEDHADSIPFANDSTEYNKNGDNAKLNNNNNNNNNSSSSSFETSLLELKSRVDSLTAELEEAKEREATLTLHMEENKHKHEEMLETLRLELEHEKQVEVETLQSEFKIQMDIELRRQAAELSQKGSGETQSSELEIVPQVTESVMCAHSVALASSPPKPPGEVSDPNVIMAESSGPLLQMADFGLHATAKPPEAAEGNLSDDSKVTSLSPLASPTHAVSPPVPNLPLTDMEKEVQAMKEEYELTLSQLRSQIEEAEEEKKVMTSTHQQRIEELERLLLEAEDRYDRLMEGVHSGDHPELNQLMKDKYDEELDLTKSLMQKDFDEALAGEKKKFVEKHRKLMADFMGDKAAEDDVTTKKHTEELESLKNSLEAEYSDKIQACEQEIERLNRDLDLLRAETPRETNSRRNSSLTEVEDITLNLQNTEVQSESPGSEDNVETSTPEKDAVITSPTKSVEYEESEEETEDQKESTLQIRTFADVVKSPSPASLLRDNEDLQMKVDQLTAQVERLTVKLAEQHTGPKASPQHSPQTSPHNTTLQAEDPALIAMLQSDLDRISAERETVQQTNERLLSLLSDTVKTYIGVEDTINRKLTQVVSNAPRPSAHGDAGDRSRPGSVEPGLRHNESHDSRHGSPAPDRRDAKGASPDPDTSHDSHCLDNTSILSNATDEGLEISQRLAESIFVGPDLDDEGEEILSDARGRLTSAVSQLLELMERSTVQLVEAKATQEDLLNTLAQRARELELSASRCSELDSQLSSEIEAKEYLGLELHKAEGLIAGYTAERESNDSRIQTLEEQREGLIIELDSTRSRLEEFQRSQSEIDSVREELSHQQNLLRENAGQETQALLNEVSNLNQEKRELTNQLQRQLDLSRKRLSELEGLAEEAERKHEAAIEEKNGCIEDMRLQLENTERQLKASKAFVNEQLTEREQERDEHQREIEKLQEMIEGKDRNANAQQRLQREIADLTEQLQSRINAQTAMHQRIVDLQLSLEDKEISAKDLKVWVSELEGQLDQKGNMEEQLKQRITKLERQLTQKSDDLEQEEEMESKENTLTESKVMKQESPIVMSPIRQGPRPSLVTLEEELQKSRLTKEELDQENNTLKQQLQQQMLQMSGLRNQIDQLRHYASEDDSDTVQLRQRLQEERDKVERKEVELAEAESRIENLEGILQTKQQEAESISARVSRILEMGDAQEENQSLKKQLEDLQSQMHSSISTSAPSLPPELLDEKNEEITDLKGTLQIMQADVEEKTEENLNHQDKIRLLQQQLKERDEEITDLQESVACLRRGEPCLDVSLPLTDEAGSMLNLSMTGRTSIQQEFEETIAQREGQVQSLEEQLDSVKEELEQKIQEVHSGQRKLAEKEEELESMKTEVSGKQEEIEKLQQELLSTAKEVDELKLSVENLQKDKDNLTDQEKMVESLDESVQQKEREVYELTMEMTEVKQQLQDMTESRDTFEKILQEREAELIQAQEERDEKKELLQEKEHKLDQLTIQIDGLQQEISSLTTFQNELQKDFDTIQSMLDEKEKEIETLTKELTDTRTSQDVLDSMMQLEGMVASLQKDLVEKQNVVDEKEEELYELHDKLEEMGNVKEEQDATQQELKQANNALQKEKQEKVELENQLTKEKSSAQELGEEKKTLAGEVEGLKQNLAKAERLLEERNMTIKEQQQKLKSTEESHSEIEKKILKLKEDFKCAEEKREEELKLLQNEKEKLKEEHQIKLKDIEEQLQVQDANYLAMQLTSERNENIHQEIEKLKQQSTEKEAALKDLQDQLVGEKEESASTIENLKKQLDSQNIEKEEIGSLKRQLEETEEQLRYRQSVLLEVQADNELLSAKVENLEKLKQELEEKNLTMSELESQLRYRQSALLELEAEKEKLMEEKKESEEKFQKDLEEKEKEFEKLQMQFIELRDGMNEEVLHMEQEMSRSKQARLIKRPQESKSEEDESMTIKELQDSLVKSADEVTDLRVKLENTEDELSKVENQYATGQNEIEELQSEILRLQQENIDLKSQLQKVEMKVKELQNSLEEALKSSAVKENEKYLEKQEQVVSQSIPSLSTASSLEFDSGAVLHHSESDSADKHISTLQADLGQLEKEASQLRFELQERNQELDDARCELEDLRINGKDQMEEIIKNKEETISALRKELEEVKSQLEEQENTALTLRDELDISTMTHHEQLTSRDDHIADLQGQLQVLKASSSVPSSPGSEGKALSPQTKHQISQLKTQLRKAHTALEEMQRGHGFRDSVDSVDSAPSPHTMELEELRRRVQEQEEELVQLRSRLNDQEEDDIMKNLQRATAEQKGELEKQHLTEVNEFMYQHQRELENARPRTESETVFMDNRDLERSEESTGSSFSLNDSMPPRVKALLIRLNEAGEDLLSATDLAFLQHCLSQPHVISTTPESLAWSEERRKLIDTILAVKELLGQADRFAVEPLDELTGDWRADLLQAIVKVYEKEKQVLRAEVGTADSMYPELDIISQLENRIHDLERVHQDGLDEIIKADRQSLLDEIDNLHHRLLDSQSHLQDARQELDQRIAALEDAKSKAEWSLKHQIQLLEQKVQQEGIIQKDLKKSLTLERQRVSELSSESSQERSKILELQSELSSTQIHLSKLKDALEREQQRFSSVTLDWSSTLDALEEEHAKTVHLSEMLDSTRKKLHTLQDETAHSQALHQQMSDSEGAFIKELQIELDNERKRSQEFSDAEELAQSQITRLSDKLDSMKNKLMSIQQDYEDRIESLHREWMEKDLHQRKENESEAISKLNDLLDAERESHRKSLEQEMNISRKLKQEMEELQMENDRLLSSFELEKARADNLKKNLDKQDRLMSSAETIQRLQTKDSETVTRKVASVVDEELKYRLAQCCTKLQIVASKLQDMTEASQQHGASASNVSGLKEGAVKVVMDELSKLKADIREQEERRKQSSQEQSEGTVPPGQLLQHNQQMAEHIMKLKKEKEHLTNMLKSLENRLQKSATTNRPTQMSLPQYTSDITSDEDGVYDRTVWASEKLSLQMALDSAEHEIQRLRTELRRFNSFMKSDGQLMKLDPDKTQRLYGKYLRAESFRKALIYQKKYLLLLLGGYRDTEQDTLAILASMGGHPSPGLSSRRGRTHSRPYTAFRSAGRVVIAIFRMKYLVRKWKRATRVGSPVMTGQISNQHAYVPPSSSSYLHPQRQHSSHHQPVSSNGSIAHTQPGSDYIESLTNGGISSLHSSIQGVPPASTELSRLQPYTTPPTKDSSRQPKASRSGKESARRQILQDLNDSDKSNSQPSSARTLSQPADSDDDNFLRYLEKVQLHLSEDSSSASSKRVAWR